MSVYIHKNNQQSGPFEDGNILEWMRNGQLSPDDLACRTGASGWQPLKILFPPVPPTPQVQSAAAFGSGAGVVNEAVVGWARQTFPAPLPIKLKANSIFFKIIGFGMLLFFPIIFAVGTVYGLITGSPASKSGVITTAITFGAAAFFFFIIRLTRLNIAKVLDADGAGTLYGKRFRWEILQRVNYKKVKPRGIVQVMLFAGAKRVNTELIFADGKAVIAPLSINQAEVLKLLETIPAQRQGEEHLH